jgi:tRNA A-37 threonylcarbamoyl transferase component Bud32
MTPTLHFTRFGRFEIVRKLGRSMSDVYLAYDPATDRQIVLKIVEQCHDSYTQAIADAERRGAVIQQQLHSIDPRILQIYDAGEQNGSFFVAMEYAEGRSLAELLKEQGRLDARQAAGYVAEICSQLASLHSFEAEIDGKKRAVVHGDIKPANIQIGPSGEVRLLDFGIAKAISATRKLTHHDLGSPAYCSPERLHSSQVDPQADLWAAGVCLYELVAGLPPYQAQTTRKLENVIQSRRPPRALPRDCPAGLRAIIQKALAADGGRRYASAKDFQEDLEAFLAGRPTAAESEREHWWHANATVETANPPGERERRWAVARYFRPLLALFHPARESLAAGVLAGFFLFVPVYQLARFWIDSAPLRSGRDYAQSSVSEVEADFQLYTRLEREYRWLRGLSPVALLRNDLQVRLVHAADRQLADYRDGSAPDLDAFDWAKAALCLRRASALAPHAREIGGKLALAEAYGGLGKALRDQEAIRLRLESASRLLPGAPDPHLALARLHVYGGRNLGRALAEWGTAQRLGFQLGPREWEQEGDAYLARVEDALRKLTAAKAAGEQRRWFAMLQRDAGRARDRYEPIAGFGNATRNLEKLDQLERTAADLRLRQEKAHAAAARRSARMRKWR